MGIEEKQDSERVGFQDAQRLAITLGLRKLEDLSRFGTDSKVWKDELQADLMAEVKADYQGDDSFDFEDYKRGWFRGVKSHLAELEL